MSEQNSKQNVSTTAKIKDVIERKTKSSEVDRRKQRTLQNYLLLWIDASIDEQDEDCKNTLQQLRKVVNEVIICTEPTQCIKCINAMDNEKAFVITSGTLGQYIVPQIHHMQKLHAIYIFCSDKIRHEQWAKEWPKIEGVFASIRSICESLKKAANQCDHDAIPMSFAPKQTVATITATEDKTLDQLPPSYMYTILFKEISLEIDEEDDKSVKSLIGYCRANGIDESELNYFQRIYREKTPIWCYTDESFLYGILNKALQLLDIEGMVKMAFFIRKLHQQLEQIHNEQSNTFQKKFTVYRGQGYSQEDFQHIQDMKDGLLAFNSFLSTSMKQEVAMDFVKENLRKYETNVGVLFTMTIDQSKISTMTTAFALIDKYSAIPTEQEILFSMHTVFRINDIQKSTTNNRLWEVQMTITDETDPQLAGLTAYMKKDIIGSGWYRMGNLMFNLQNFEQAEMLYNQLLEEATSDSDRAHIFFQLGLMKHLTEEHKEAISFYEKSLEIKRKTLKEDDPSLANIYSVILENCMKISDYSKQCEYQKKLMKIDQEALNLTDKEMATKYHNIGRMCYEEHEYSRAIQFLERSIQMREKTLPTNHPDLAVSYGVIGEVYRSTGDYTKALEFLERSIQIQEKVLPISHPELATSYWNIGLVYDNMSDYSQALKFLEKSVKIDEKTFRMGHPCLAKSYFNIAYVYDAAGNSSKALELLQKAKLIWDESLAPKDFLTEGSILAAQEKIDCLKKKLQF